MREEILKGVKQLLLTHHLPLDEVYDVYHPSFSYLYLWLAHLPLDGDNQHPLEHLPSHRPQGLLQLGDRNHVLDEHQGVHPHL